MISAFISVGGPTLDTDIDAVDGICSRHHHRTGRREGDAYDAGAGNEQVGTAVGINAHDALAPGERSGHIQPALVVESHALRTAKAAVERLHLAFMRDAINRVEARRSGAGDVQIA